MEINVLCIYRLLIGLLAIQHRMQVMNSFIIKDQVLVQDHELDHLLDQVLVLIAVFFGDSVIMQGIVLPYLYNHTTLHFILDTM